MGVVWRAADRRLGRDVAMKVLHPWIAEDADLRERFSREAEALAQLTHPHIVRVYDFEESGEAAFLVMELIEGHSFSDMLRPGTRLTWEEGRQFLAPVANALAHAHARGVVHRDLTPANILIEADTGRVVVSDFGLARIARAARSLTATGVLIGTPEYWSPEQATGGETDGSTDMYALGCILFMTLAGRLPFVGDDRLAVGLRRAYEDAPSIESVVPGIPEDAQTLLAALLSRDPSGRPPAADVERALTNAPERPVPPGDTSLDVAEAQTVAAPDRAGTKPHVRATRRRSKRRLFGIAGGTMFATAVALAIVFYPDADPIAAPPKQFVVPRLIGVTPEQAEKRVANAARKAGIKAPRLRITSEVYSELVKRGVIVSQAPRPRAPIPVDDPEPALRVRISKGTAWTSVPAVVGTTYDAAVVTLRIHGLHADRVEKSSWSAPYETVLASAPPAGSRAHRDRDVRLVVSSGVPTEQVPKLHGETLASARERLGALGFRVAVSTEKASRPADDGVVVRTRPQWGSVAPIGSTVEVFIGHTPQWRVAYRFSGSGAATRQTPSLQLPEKWRIRYSIVGTPLAQAIVTWRAEDGFEEMGYPLRASYL